MEPPHSDRHNQQTSSASNTAQPSRDLATAENISQLHDDRGHDLERALIDPDSSEPRTHAQGLLSVVWDPPPAWRKVWKRLHFPVHAIFRSFELTAVFLGLYKLLAKEHQKIYAVTITVVPLSLLVGLVLYAVVCIYYSWSRSRTIGSRDTNETLMPHAQSLYVLQNVQFPQADNSNNHESITDPNSTVRESHRPEPVSAYSTQSALPLSTDGPRRRHVTKDLESSSLSDAAKRGDITMVQQLLKQGVDPNDGIALHEASHYGHKTIARLLLENKADPNKEGGHYGSALLAASFEGHTEIIQMLLENNANVNRPWPILGAALGRIDGRLGGNSTTTSSRPKHSKHALRDSTPFGISERAYECSTAVSREQS